MKNLPSKKRKPILLYPTLFCLYFFVLTFILFYFGLFSNFSTIKLDKNKLIFASTQVEVYDKNNNKIENSLNSSNKLNFEQIPKEVINAFISAEDKNFYNHKGLNYKRILKSALKNIKDGRVKEGASTISQQLIKNTHLTSEKTLKRKINEALLTQKLEKNFSKNEILTAYLNAIYFGSGAFGINNASQRFFSKDASQLNLVESATLAGIVKSPKLYSPITNKINCLNRRNYVLKQMLNNKKITKDDYEKAIKEDINLNINSNFLGNNNYYHASVEEACKILNITEKDLILNKYKIITYQDTELQKVVETQTKNYQNYTSNTNCDYACIITDNSTGGILAFLGKSDYNLLNVYRQPGSVLKPIISYAPALEYNKITPLTPILDEKINLNGYTPNNYKNKYHGWISAKNALAYSLNIPSVKILEYVGINKAKSFTKKMGINLSDLDANYSLALGGLTNGVRFLDITNCYQTFANNGSQIKNSFIKEIRTQNGTVVYKNSENKKQIIKSSTAFLITDMLKESVKTGTSKKLRNFDFEIASKTGTVPANENKKENKDVWNISYTPQTTTCVWFGSTSSKNLPEKITGGSAPCSIAKNIYENMKITKKVFEKPDDIVVKSLNELEYKQNNRLLLANENTPERYKLKAYFSKDFCPQEESVMFNELEETEIWLDETKSSPTIQFNAKGYLTYDLVRETDDGQTSIVQSIENKNELVSICDKSTKEGNFYTYYLKIKYANNSINQTKQSNTIKVFVAQK